MNRQKIFVVFFVALMFITLIGTYFLAILVPLGYVYLGFFLCFITAIVWSALRHRSHGWISGLIFVGLLTSPVWIVAGIHLYQIFVAAS